VGALKEKYEKKSKIVFPAATSKNLNREALQPAKAA
jgi:hypothetical protein